MPTFARLHPLNRDVDHHRGIAYEVQCAAAEDEVKNRSTRFELFFSLWHSLVLFTIAWYEEL